MKPERSQIVVYAVEYLINNGVSAIGGENIDNWEHLWVLAGTDPTRAIKFASDTGGRVFELKAHLFWERPKTPPIDKSKEPTP